MLRAIKDVRAVARSDQKSKKWYSGATSHMACVKDFLASLDLNRKYHVCLADEKILVEIQGIRTCTIKSSLYNGEIKEIVVKNCCTWPGLAQTSFQ